VRGTAGEQSTGLGLAIVRSIVMGHGGTIGVTSEVGVGSTFSFTLKKSAPQESLANPPDLERPVGDPSSPHRAIRVLLVEDNAINQRIVGMMLAKLEAEVLVAKNGREALSLFEQTELDLILMDCQMPEMDGYEAAAAIRKTEIAHGRKRLPIIALTASQAESDRERCLAAGMDDFLPKPPGLPQLSEMVERWVRKE
jgi:CheY-like chemotaxis protein